MIRLKLPQIILLSTVFLLIGGIIARDFLLGLFEFSIAVSLLFGLYVWYQAKIRANTLPLPKDARVWLWVILLFIVLNYIPEIIHILNGEKYEGRLAAFFERYAHLLAVIAIFFTMLYLRLPVISIWKLLILCALWVGLVIVFEAIYYNLLPSNWHQIRFGAIASSSTIDFGIYANMLFIILLGAFFWARILGFKWVVLLVIAIVVLFTGTILSQSRTAWIGWPEAFIGWGLLFLYFLKSKNKRQLFVLTTSLILVFLLVILSPLKNPIVDRFNLVVKDVHMYLDGDPRTSLGYRFVMYEAAILQIKKQPLTGMSINNFETFLPEATERVFAERFGINEQLTFTQIHNQFLMTALVRGIPVAIFSMLIFAWLLYYFVKRLQEFKSIESKTLPVAGVVFTVAAFLSTLPESPFFNKVMLIYYFLVFSILIYMCEKERISNSRKD